MTDTRNMLEQQVTAQLDHWTAALDFVTEYAADPDFAADEGMSREIADELAETYGPTDDRFDVLDTEALSVEYDWTGPTRADVNVSRIRIVLGTGGPHVEIVAEIGQGLTIAGHWTGTTVTRRFYHQATADLVVELAELAEVSG